MVPAEFTGYFTAAAAAAGVLIGLLFVAVSLRPETVFGESAPPGARAQAGSAFISLVSIGRLHRPVPRQDIQALLLALGVGTYLYQLIVGVLLVTSPKDRGQVFSLAYLAIASFAVALSRAWSLVQGKHLRPGASAVAEK